MYKVGNYSLKGDNHWKLDYHFHFLCFVSLSVQFITGTKKASSALQVCFH